MEETFQELIQRLGNAINDAITTSDEVDGALSRVRAMGIDVFLVLEATICVRSRDGEPVSASNETEETLDEVEIDPFDVSPEDRQFLKRLRISVETGDEAADGTRE